MTNKNVTDDGRCGKCNQRLKVDIQSYDDFKIRGYIGARLFCLLGCTSFYIKHHLKEEEQFVERREPIRHKTHALTLHTIICELCGTKRETTGNNCRYCEECSRRIKRERERLLKRRRSKSVA